MEKSNDENRASSKQKGHKTAKTDMSGSLNASTTKKLSAEELKARRQTDLAVQRKKDSRPERISLRTEELKEQKREDLSPRSNETEKKRRRFSMTKEKDPVLFTHKRTPSDDGRAGTLENISPRYRKLSASTPPQGIVTLNKSPKKSTRGYPGWKRIFHRGQIPSIVEEQNTLIGVFAALAAHFCIPNLENRLDLTPRSSIPSLDGEYTSEDVPADWELDKVIFVYIYIYCVRG